MCWLLKCEQQNKFHLMSFTADNFELAASIDSWIVGRWSLPAVEEGDEVDTDEEDCWPPSSLLLVVEVELVVVSLYTRDLQDEVVPFSRSLQ